MVVYKHEDMGRMVDSSVSCDHYRYRRIEEYTESVRLIMARITSFLERYILISWAILGFCGLVLIYWAAERKPPFEMVDYKVHNAVRGETAYVNAKVTRDLNRDCTVTFVRYLIDRDKVRHDIGGTQYMTSAALHQMERDMPNSLNLALRLPEDLPVGPAKLVTALEYRCNPMHHLMPMDVLLEMQLDVMP